MRLMKGDLVLEKQTLDSGLLSENRVFSELLANCMVFLDPQEQTAHLFFYLGENEVLV
jgi:hypothetical protein